MRGTAVPPGEPAGGLIRKHLRDCRTETDRSDAAGIKKGQPESCPTILLYRFGNFFSICNSANLSAGFSSSISLVSDGIP